MLYCCLCPQAPWMLSLIEVVSLLLILLLLTHRLPGPYECHFESCLDDVVLVGGLQAAVLSGTYAWGSRSNRLRYAVSLSQHLTGLGLDFAGSLQKLKADCTFLLLQQQLDHLHCIALSQCSRCWRRAALVVFCQQGTPRGVRFDVACRLAS